MKKIVFLAPYPSRERLKEGMMQRVDAVDRIFSGGEYRKVYIVPRLKSVRTVTKEPVPGTLEIRLSVWRSLRSLRRILKNADVIYSHSLYGMSIAAPLFLRLLRKKNFVWDVHGIIPEEIRLAGQPKIKQRTYGLLERMAVRYAGKIIVVTQAMARHLQDKYPRRKQAKYLVYPILPATIRTGEDAPGQTDGTSGVNLLYAGNTQGYQNIPRMIRSIKKLADTPGLNFHILTGEKDRMARMFESEGLGEMPNIHIDSVMPEELDAYYRKAHYGYILRDDVDVNRVACPTKIIEYLAYGITCITLSPDIGDLRQMGFDHIHVDELSPAALKAAKSDRNRQVYEQLSKMNDTGKIKGFVLDTL